MKRWSARAFLCLVMCWPVQLFAHAKLVRSEPAKGASIAQPLSQVRLWFSETPSIALSTVSIIAPSGDTVRLTRLRLDAEDKRLLLANVPKLLSPGVYRIAWRIVAGDGHPKYGSIDFSIVDAKARRIPAAVATDSSAHADSSAPAGSEVLKETDAEAMAFGGAFAAIAARWISFLAVFVVIGVVAFRVGVLARMGPGATDTFMHIASSNGATLGIVASAGVLLAAALKLARESADMPDVRAGRMLFASAWGFSVFLQMIGAVGAAAAFRVAQTGREGSRLAGWRAAALSAAVLATALSLGAHAATNDRAFLTIPADVLHIVAGSCWLGTLAVIVIVGIPAALKSPDVTRPGERVARMINTFSPLALVCGGLVAASGAVASLIHLRQVADLWRTPYGVALSVKLLFVAILFGAGAWNWRRMKPRLTGDDAVTPMRSVAWFELLLATIVLGITAILVALELP